MLMKMKTTFIIALMGTGILACSSGGSGGPAELDAAAAKQKAITVVPGTASEPAKLDKDDEHRWVVDVKVSNGATVGVEIARATGVIEEIKGEERPFDYELPAPQPGMLTYAAAKSKALAAKVGAVEVWEVKPPANQYEFYVRDEAGKLWEIKMTGDKGDVTGIVQKDKPD